jgi:hypothetical protein
VKLWFYRKRWGGRWILCLDSAYIGLLPSLEVDLLGKEVTGGWLIFWFAYAWRKVVKGGAV